MDSKYGTTLYPIDGERVGKLETLAKCLEINTIQDTIHALIDKAHSQYVGK